MKEWIKELCPEIADWQCELIADEVDKAVAREREACARVCDVESRMWDHLEVTGRGRDRDRAEAVATCAAAIRARGEG